MSKVTLSTLGAQISGVVETLPEMTVESTLDSILAAEVKKSEPREVIVQAHVPAVEGNESKGIEARPEVAEQVVSLTPENREAILAGLASLPQFRSMFAGAVAQRVAEARAKSKKQYDAWRAELKKLREGVENVREAMLEADQEAAGEYDLEEFVHWGEESVVPRDFSKPQSSGKSGGRGRSRSKAKWSLDHYYCAQRNVGSLHDVELHKSGSGWIVNAQEGSFGPYGSPSEAMKETLVSQDMSPSRSAVVFWGAVEQEEGGVPNAWQ